MRVGIFTDTYAPQINGVVTSIQTFVRAWEARGHQAYVFCPRVHGEPLSSGNVFRFRSATFPFHREYRASLPNPVSIIRQTEALALDILHTHTPFALGLWGLRLSRRLRIPLVHTYHTFYSQYVHYVPFIPRPLAQSWAVKMSRGYCNLCDLVITPSQEMRGLLANYGITTPIRVIPTGVDIPAIQTQDPGRARERFGISTAAPFLLYVGRVGKEKGLDFLLRAFAFVRRELPEARLVISGGGTERRHMVAYAGALGLASSVTFTGYLQRQELFELYATADVFVFSSRTETQGLVLVEALAVGTPVVAVRAMGVSEVLDRERGGLLTTPREDDFARAVLRVLREPDLRKQKSREARERAQELSAAQMAASVEKEFAALLRARLQSRTFSDGTKHPAA